MEPMVYDGSGVTRLLHVEECNGEQIVVLNIRGSHPCAYVTVPESETKVNLSKIENEIYDYYYTENGADVHGGFTYGKYGKPFESDNIREAFWLGWDYAHLGDYCCYGEGLPSMFKPKAYEKMWTTEEIVEAARDVAGHVKYDEDMYD